MEKTSDYCRSYISDSLDAVHELDMQLGEVYRALEGANEYQLSMAFNMLFSIKLKLLAAVKGVAETRRELTS